MPKGGTRDEVGTSNIRAHPRRKFYQTLYINVGPGIGKFEQEKESRSSQLPFTGAPRSMKQILSNASEYSLLQMA